MTAWSRRRCCPVDRNDGDHNIGKAAVIVKTAEREHAVAVTGERLGLPTPIGKPRTWSKIGFLTKVSQATPLQPRVSDTVGIIKDTMQPLCKDCLRVCHRESTSRRSVKVTGKSRVLCLHFHLVLEFPTTGRVEKSQLSVSSVDAQ